MPPIEELLRATLKRATEKFDQVNGALHAAVVEAKKAVEAVTGGMATLRLDERSNDEFETRYDLDVVVKGNDVRTLANIGVRKKGYPIYRYHDADSMNITEKFDSAEALTAYFNKLAADPDSQLIAYLAYAVRNPPPLGDGDPIPF
jgi:hypothetical protein